MTVSLLAHSTSAHPTIPVFNCYIVITLPPWPIYCLTSFILPHLHMLYIVLHMLYTVLLLLLIVCLFIPFVTLCRCMCQTALLYLGQVAVANENLFSTSLSADRESCLTYSSKETLLYLFFYVLFLTLLSQKMLCVITFNREELLDIRATVTHQSYQYYNQEYDFLGVDRLFSPPRTI